MNRSTALLVLVAMAGAAVAQPVPPQPTPNVPVGNDVFGDPIQGPGAWPASLSAATIRVSLPQNTVNGRFGSNALVVNNLVSGPFRWTSGNTNEGDIDFVIGPAQPGDERSYPTWAGWDAFRESGGLSFPNLTLNPLSPVFPLPASQWPDSENWGRLRLTGSVQYALPNFAWGVHPARGVIIATTAVDGRDNVNFDRFDRTTAMGTFYAHAHVTDDGGDSTGRGYSPITGDFRGTGLYVSTYVVGSRPGEQDEAVVDVSAAYFPYEQGWIGGYWTPVDSTGAPNWRSRDGLLCASPNLSSSVVASTDFLFARYTITLPEVTPADGMLFAQNVNDTNESSILGVLPTATGWDIAQRYDEVIDTAGTASFAFNDGDARFAFVFVPWNSCGLVGAHIAGDGSTIRGAGAFTLTRASEGVYQVRIAGATSSTGALLVHNAGATPTDATIPDNTFYSVNFVSGADPYFEIHSRVLATGANTWGESYPHRDSSFYFMYVDFTNPPAPAECAPPCDPDVNQDGNVDQDDIACLAQAVGGTPDCLGGGVDPDFNRDGNVDQDDIASLEQVVGGAPCP
ncbi:MAG: hypothetical protein SFY69_07435 [Planctomycetota bacterium]|nr:hypothetical protein [Planctomycetota bacterium]